MEGSNFGSDVHGLYFSSCIIHLNQEEGGLAHKTEKRNKTKQ